MDQFLRSFSAFLLQMQELNIMKEFSLNALEDCTTDLSKLQTPIKIFMEEANKTLGSIDQKLSEELKKDNIEASNPVNKNNVQLQVDGSEIRRRISAFLSRKRKEVEEWNVQEFCSRPYIDEQNPVWEQMDSCARVDAVFIPRFGSKSHVKVSKVENRWGPQTRLQGCPTKKIKTEAIEESDHQKTASIEAAQERIQLMESHLNLNADSSARSSIFKRIKQLEDRILYLEGISPDYFSKAMSSYVSEKKRNVIEKEKAYLNWTVDDIQKRIQALTDSLKSKSQVRMEFPEKF